MKTVLLLLVVLVTACAPLNKRDSTLGDIGEVAGRTLLCPVTLCISEIAFYGNWKEAQRQQQLEEYSRWYHSLTPEQQDRQDQRVIAAAQALSAMPRYQFPQPAQTYNAPRYQVPTYNQAPEWRPREQTSCASNVIGDWMYTTCR